MLIIRFASAVGFIGPETVKIYAGIRFPELTKAHF